VGLHRPSASRRLEPPRRRHREQRTSAAGSPATRPSRCASTRVPATGRTITFRTSDTHLIRGNRIVKTWHLEDLFGAYQQMTAPEPAK
jgi:hypothetical protein